MLPDGLQQTTQSDGVRDVLEHHRGRRKSLLVQVTCEVAVVALFELEAWVGICICSMARRAGQASVQKSWGFAREAADLCEERVAYRRHHQISLDREAFLDDSLINARLLADLDVFLVFHAVLEPKSRLQLERIDQLEVDLVIAVQVNRHRRADHPFYLRT